jgi:hypothetical protein
LGDPRQILPKQKVYTHLPSHSFLPLQKGAPQIYTAVFFLTIMATFVMSTIRQAAVDDNDKESTTDLLRDVENDGPDYSRTTHADSSGLLTSVSSLDGHGGVYWRNKMTMSRVLTVGFVGTAALVMVLVMMTATSKTTTLTIAGTPPYFYTRGSNSNSNAIDAIQHEMRTLMEVAEPIDNRSRLFEPTRPRGRPTPAPPSSSSSSSSTSSSSSLTTPVPTSAPTVPAMTLAPAFVVSTSTPTVSLIPIENDATTKDVSITETIIPFTLDASIVGTVLDPASGTTVYSNPGGYGYASTKAATTATGTSVSRIRFRPLDSVVYKSIELKSIVDDSQVSVVVMFTNGRLYLGQNNYVGDYDTIAAPELELVVEETLSLISLYTVIGAMDGSTETKILLASMPYDAVQAGPLYATLGFHSSSRVASLEAVAYGSL